jgi:DNA-binding NarL/FixJ family response regulator
MGEGGIIIVTKSKKIAGMIKEYVREWDNAPVCFALCQEELEDRLEKAKPKLVLLESNCWFNATPYMVAWYLPRFPKLNVAVFSFERLSAREAARFIRCGADSFIDMRSADDGVCSAFARILSGAPSVPDGVAAEVDKADYGRERKADFTLREMQVMALSANGKNERDIASILNLNVYTIKNFKRHIYEKSAVCNIAELTHFALYMGFISFEGLYPPFGAGRQDGGGRG